VQQPREPSFRRQHRYHRVQTRFQAGAVPADLIGLEAGVDLCLDDYASCGLVSPDDVRPPIRPVVLAGEVQVARQVNAGIHPRPASEVREDGATGITVGLACRVRSAARCHRCLPEGYRCRRGT
jgi:hypothetical protein